MNTQVSDYQETLRRLLPKVDVAERQNERNIECPVHGAGGFARFLTPKPHSLVVARYVCARCLDGISAK
jgi:hypothetical protein